MNRRVSIIGVSILFCVAALVAVFSQRKQLTGLRNQQPIPASIDDSVLMTRTPPVPDGASPELLRLRSEVSQLTERKRELAGARSENERLRAQLAARKANPSAEVALPPGFIRRADARWMGMSTPENTVESFLWALQNHDLTNLVQLLTESSATNMLRAASRSPEYFFLSATMEMPGMRLVNQKQLPDGSISAQLELPPGSAAEYKLQEITFQQIDGKWKMDLR
jgi:hypothetical protein